jgi:hypothetical protein
VPGHARGRAEGEEDAQPDDGLEDDRGDAEAGELRGAEVADDSGVGEQEERLGDEREEGGDGQAQDLAIGLAVGRPLTLPVGRHVWNSRNDGRRRPCRTGYRSLPSVYIVPSDHL